MRLIKTLFTQLLLSFPSSAALKLASRWWTLSVTVLGGTVCILMPSNPWQPSQGEGEQMRRCTRQDILCWILRTWLKTTLWRKEVQVPIYPFSYWEIFLLVFVHSFCFWHCWNITLYCKITLFHLYHVSLLAAQEFVYAMPWQRQPNITYSYGTLLTSTGRSTEKQAI